MHRGTSQCHVQCAEKDYQLDSLNPHHDGHGHHQRPSRGLGDSLAALGAVRENQLRKTEAGGERENKQERQLGLTRDHPVMVTQTGRLQSQCRLLGRRKKLNYGLHVQTQLWTDQTLVKSEQGKGEEKDRRKVKGSQGHKRADAAPELAPVLKAIDNKHIKKA